MNAQCILCTVQCSVDVTLKNCLQKVPIVNMTDYYFPVKRLCITYVHAYNVHVYMYEVHSYIVHCTVYSARSTGQ